MQTAHSGCAFMALRAGVPLVPLALIGTYELLPIHVYSLRPRPLMIIVGDPIPTAGLTTKDADALTARLYDEIGKMYYQYSDSHGEIAGGRFRQRDPRSLDHAMTRPRIAIPIPSTDPEYSSQAWQQYASGNRAQRRRGRGGAAGRASGHDRQADCGVPGNSAAGQRRGRESAEVWAGAGCGVRSGRPGPRECGRAAAAGRAQYGQADLHHLLWDPDAECLAGRDAGAASDRSGCEPQGGARRSGRPYRGGGAGFAAWRAGQR